MAYCIGQIIGIVAAIGCAILPLFRKKWQMLVCSGLSALCFGLNLLLLGETGSGFIISIVCVIQTLIALWHLQKGVPVTVRENAVFLVLYVGCGILGFRSALDVLPIIASIFNMWATFQKDVHKSRILILMNASSFFVYYLLLGSTACIAELIAIATAIFTIRKKRTKRDGDPLP